MGAGLDECGVDCGNLAVLRVPEGLGLHSFEVGVRIAEGFPSGFFHGEQAIFLIARAHVEDVAGVDGAEDPLEGIGGERIGELREDRGIAIEAVGGDGDHIVARAEPEAAGHSNRAENVADSRNA